MIQTQTDVITEFFVEMNESSTAGFYTDAITKQWYAKASAWAASKNKWPFTEGKQSTTYVTTITDEYGNVVLPYPEGWRHDSIRILTIGGKRLQKLGYADLLRFKEDNAGTTERVYSDYGGNLYINSLADVSGTMTSYGQYNPNIDTTDDTATTIFGSNQDGNTALVEMMMAYAFQRERTPTSSGTDPSTLSEIHEAKANLLLDTLWKSFADEQYGYQTKDRDMFARFDVMRGGYPNDLFNRDQFN